MSVSPFEAALNQICDEKGLPKDIVIAAIEAALAAAYRKDYGNPRQIVRAKLNYEDITKTEMFQVYEIVKKDEIVDEFRQMELKEAKKIQKSLKIGEELTIKLPHQDNFGRIAAQTAKQVIIQRLGEAERDMLYQEFKDKEGRLINATVQQIEGQAVVVNLGKINGVMPPVDQIPHEKYFVGQRIKVFVSGVEKSSHGPRIIVSRSKPELIKGLFELEVPEIAQGTVSIEGITREAGLRTKMAVIAHQNGLDPIGSCVGQRGIRIQAVLAEIGDEKIDIILFDDNIQIYLANALSPAKVEKIKLNKETKSATVYVKDDQLSLAIGKSGQNVRLASQLTSWKIDIEKVSDTKQDQKDEKANQENKNEPDIVNNNVDETENIEKKKNKKTKTKKNKK